MRVLLDEDLADGLLELGLRHSSGSFHARTASSQPGASATPGTATTSSPETTIGHVSRSSLGTFASTSTSCTFFERPASRSPGRRVRTTSPGRELSIRHGPKRDAALEAHARRTRAPRARRRRGPRTSSRRSTRGAPRACARAPSAAAGARRRARGGSGRRRDGAGGGAAGSRSRMSPRFVSAFDESRRNSSPCSSQ